MAANRSRESLIFRDITISDIPVVRNMLLRSGSRTCDFTVGGLFMWVDFFRYQYCIYRDTLFVKGVVENHRSVTAFSMPVGALPLDESVGILRDYCGREGMELCFSAIPADRVREFMGIGEWEVEELSDWADYLYDIDSLATLQGKAFNKKRNHVNRFMAENPGAKLSDAGADMVRCMEDSFIRWNGGDGAIESETARAERQMVLSVMENMEYYPFDWAVLLDSGGRPVAFTAGEVIGDTLFVHIEKVDRSVAGAGETVNFLFARKMRDRYPGLKYVNREEDAGDEGLRRAKQSYHPVMMLSKYNLKSVSSLYNFKCF